MNKTILITLAMVFMLGCNSNERARKEAIEKISMSTTQKLKGIKTDNSKDLACGMPLSAGIEDTVRYGGKLYGFCSKECRDAFKKNPSSYIAQDK